MARWLNQLIILATLAVCGLGMFVAVPRLGGGEKWQAPETQKAVGSERQAPSCKERIRIVTALLPPQMDSKGKGREADIIEAAFRAGGLDESTCITFHALPFTRHWQAFIADGKGDNRYEAVTTVPAGVKLVDEAVTATPAGMKIIGLHSSRYVQYQNGIIYWREGFPDGLGDNVVQALAALTQKKVIAFAGATVVLNGVQQVRERADFYFERSDQRSHSIMLASGEVDAVIADELIFSHYTSEVLGEDAYPEFARKIVFDPVFCPTEYVMVFRTERYRDVFNAGLEKIRGEEYRKIQNKYADKSGIRRFPRTKQIGGCN